MKQVMQSLKDGSTIVADVPVPVPGRGQILIRTHKSLVSIGTEKMLVEFGKASYLEKAKQQPEKVKMVLDKVRTDGLMATYDAVRAKLDQMIPLGYSNVGEVVAVGHDVSEFSIGDRVVSNGPHAEYVVVGKNLCVKIPDNVSDDTAAFTVVAAIGLQSIRLANPTIGETFCVMGTGLIGLLTIQLLRANGCQVIATDYSEDKLKIAASYGAETINLSANPNLVDTIVNRYGEIDGTIIAAATKSNQPVIDAAKVCRKRGRIVLLGVSGLELSRDEFFKKELSFQVSCSYGPGRYDPEYEQKGHDYPLGYVRWTEKRNFAAVLNLMSSGLVRTDALQGKAYPIEQAAEMYPELLGDATNLGVTLSYPANPISERFSRVTTLKESSRGPAGTVRASLIGAGNYARQMMLPAIKKADAELVTVVTNSGSSSYDAARKFDFANAATDPAEVFADAHTNTVFIATRHDSHAQYATEALRGGRHVFVEKPLALTLDELEEIEEAHKSTDKLLMVGFNRRFSPLTRKLKSLLPEQADVSTVITVNAGYIPQSHWTQDPHVGGGRIIGEACHFIDLVRYLHGSPIASFQVTHLDGLHADKRFDNVMISLSMENGTMATIHYLANGDKSFPKERVEVFGLGQVFQISNFLTLEGFGAKTFKKLKLRKQDKGHEACIREFIEAIEKGLPSPIPFSELMEVSRRTIEIDNVIRNGGVQQPGIADTPIKASPVDNRAGAQPARRPLPTPARGEQAHSPQLEG